MTDSRDVTTLPCGRDGDALVAQVADGGATRLDAHQQGCPYCRSVLAELDNLWAPVRAVADHRPPPVPDGLVDDALRRLRGVAADPEYARIEDGAGHTTIAARVVVVLARHLAAQVPGVRAALSRLVGGGSTAVEITLAASYGQDLAALGDRIRATVARGVHEHTGLDAITVHVVVDDVLDAP